MIWWGVLSTGLALGAWLIGWGVAHLREAHLYRQSSGEGLKFAWVFFAFFWAHLSLGAAGWAVMRLRAGVGPTGVRRALFGIGVVIVGGLLAADVLFVWVDSHDDRCIGPCGPEVWPPF